MLGLTHPRRIDRAINRTDRMVLICSEASLSGQSSWWVQQEIERALDRERIHQKATGETLVYLIPVAIDRYLFSDDCSNPYKRTLTARNVATFAGWEGDSGIYHRGLSRLVNALRVSPVRPGDFNTPRQ